MAAPSIYFPGPLNAPSKWIFRSQLHVQILGIMAMAVFLFAGVQAQQIIMQAQIADRVELRPDCSDVLTPFNMIFSSRIIYTSLILGFLALIATTIFTGLRFSHSIEWAMWRLGISDEPPTEAENFGVPPPLRGWAKEFDNLDKLLLSEGYQRGGSLVIHEFRPKLTLIRNQAESLAGTYFQAPEVEALQQSISSAKEYLDALGAFVGGTLADLDIVDISDVIKRSLNQFYKPDDRSRLRTESLEAIPAQTYKVYGVSSLLAASIVQLVKNALEYTAGDVYITVRLGSEDTVVIRVEDYGPSISDRDLHARMRLSNKSGQTPKGEHQGLGLPMVQAYKLVSKINLVF